MSLIVPSRRSFLIGLGAAIAAPAIVRAASLMPVSALFVPPRELIGSIRPNVGPIPDGWIECNGQWVIKRTHYDLYKIIGGKYGETRDTFNVPDLRGRAIEDRANNQIVGRYVINGGSQRSAHVAFLNRTTEAMPRCWQSETLADEWE